MNIETYQVEHVLEFGSKCTGFIWVKDYFIATCMSDEGIGSLGIWNAKWNFSRIDWEEYPNLIICFNLNDEFWVLTTYGEIHVFRITDKIGIIQLK